MTDQHNNTYVVPKDRNPAPAPFLNKMSFALMTMIAMFAAGGYVLNGDELPDWVGIIIAFGPIAFAIVYKLLPDGE